MSISCSLFSLSPPFCLSLSPSPSPPSFPPLLLPPSLLPLSFTPPFFPLPLSILAPPFPPLPRSPPFLARSLARSLAPPTPTPSLPPFHFPWPTAQTPCLACRRHRTPRAWECARARGGGGESGISRFTVPGDYESVVRILEYVGILYRDAQASRRPAPCDNNNNNNNNNDNNNIIITVNNNNSITTTTTTSSSSSSSPSTTTKTQ